MRVDPLGEFALILRDLEHPAFRIAQWIRESSIPGVTEAVSSYATVGVYIAPGFERKTIVEHLVRVPVRLPALESRSVVIPVCYELGDDLAAVGDRLGMSPQEVAAAHASGEYECFAIGFCPGFPYLGYLPEGLYGIPRREEPRVRVPAGSVAITGRQTGIYPLEMPGGWALIGRTPLEIVDVEDGYFPIKAGDKVRFEAIQLPDYKRLEGQRLQ